MLSNACQYAIRSVLYLSLYASDSNKLGVKNIADALETPQPFLAKLLQELKKANIVSSTKGPKGGFYLNAQNFNKRIWDIIKLIDGEDKFNKCFLGLSKCEDSNPCPVHYIASPFKKKILADFKDKTILKFSKEIKASNKVLSLKDYDFLH